MVNQALASILSGLSIFLETDGLDFDEAGGGRRFEVSDLVHGGLGSVVELLGVGPASENNEVTLVNTASDSSVDVLLGSSDAGGQEFHFRGEEHSVVQNLTVVDLSSLANNLTKHESIPYRNEVVSESTDFTVEG